MKGRILRARARVLSSGCCFETEGGEGVAVGGGRALWVHESSRPGPGNSSPRIHREKTPTMLNESLWTGIDGIVFDAVGTLIDPYPSVAEVYAEAARRQGVHIERS